MGILGQVFQSRDLGLSQINNPNIPLYQALTAYGDGPLVSSGVTVNQNTAMRVIAVNACVKLIAETIAALPIQTFNRGDESRVPVRKPSEAYIWDQPNPEMTPMEFWEQTFGSLLTDGNAFIEPVRFRQSGAIAEIWPVAASAVTIERSNTGRKFFTIGQKDYDTTQIFHIPAFRLAGMDRGFSPISAARQGIGVAIAAEKLAAKFFGQGSIMSGLIETEADLDEEMAAKLVAHFNQLHAGPENAFKVGVLDNSATFRQLSIPPEDLQFMEARKFQVTEIARLYQVPPHMIADVEKSTSWGTGIEQQQLGFVVYTLLRWIIRTEQYITKFLLPSRDRYAKWNLSALLRGDMTSRGNFYQTMRQVGALNIDDIRELEDMPPLPNGLGMDYLQPLNFAPVGSPAANGTAEESNSVTTSNGVTA